MKGMGWEWVGWFLVASRTVKVKENSIQVKATEKLEKYA